MSTYKPIQHIIVPSTGSFIFSNIPQNYTDLVLVVNGLASSPTATGLRFNGDTSSSYSATYLDGTTAASSYRETNANTGWGGSYYSDRPSSVVINIMNYANTNTNKTFITRYGSGKTIVNITAGLWRKTEAINSINVYTGATFNTTTTATLYGIESALSEQAKATGGDSIYRDSSYWYHIFNKSGTFTPAQNLSNVDYLIVAGGGGGGSWYYGGGGGAGGLRSTVTATGGGGSLESKISLSGNNAYVITVGAGGIGSSLYASGGDGSDGSSSSIAGTGITTISSVGGGGGGGTGNNGRSGGSGGGSGGAGTAGSNNSFGTGGSGQNGQGYSGGSGFNVPGDGAGGGGGGAGAVGGNGVGGDGGNGGNGVTISITGSSIIYGGGGGGSGYTGTIGTGGTGGGGSSTVSGSGNSGTTNLGGGGGGGAAVSANGGNGGSGIVIVRYPV